MVQRIDNVDDATGPNTWHDTEPDDPLQRDRVGKTARLDDDGVEIEGWVGKTPQSRFQTFGVVEAANAAA